jgi:hypothetical protein
VLDSKSTFFILQLVTNVVREWPDLRNGLNTYRSEQVLPRERGSSKACVAKKWHQLPHKQGGVSHYGLAIYIKKYLKAKEELKKSG